MDRRIYISIYKALFTLNIIDLSIIRGAKVDDHCGSEIGKQKSKYFKPYIDKLVNIYSRFSD